MAERTEVVRLTLQDDFTSKMARAATAAAALDKSLSGIDGQNVRVSQSSQTVTQAVTRQGAAFQQNSSSINQFTGRLRLLTEAAVIGGPALVAMGAVGGVALAGLASGLGFAAVGAGTLTAGMSGVFDTLDLLNKAQLEPTEANLEALRLSMQQLSPDARNMVREIDKLGPALTALRDASAAGSAPEVERLVDNLLEGLPRLRDLFEETANATAGVLADGAGILTSERWQPFLNFVEREAPRAIESLGRSAGDAAHGVAEIFRAMDPLNDDVLGLIERGAEGFDRWASGLKGSDDFKAFMDYMRENGPLVGDALSSVAGAVVAIAEATAPLAGPGLRAISGIADGVAAIAGSDLGAPFAAAIAAALTLNRTLKVTAGLAAAAGLVGGAGAGRGAASKLPLVGGAAAAAAGGAAAGGAGKTPKAGPGPAAALAAVAIAPAAIEFVQDLSGGYDGLGKSVEGVARALQRGRVPEELLRVGDSAQTMRERSESSFLSFSDTLDSTFGMVPEGVEKARTELSTLDNALSQVARQGGVKEAQKAFNGLADSLGLDGGERATLLGQLPKMGNQLSSFGGKAKDVSRETKLLAEELFHLDVKDVKPKVDLNRAPFDGAIKGVTGALKGFDKSRANPKADLDDNPFQQNYKRTKGDLTSLDRDFATPTANLNDSPFQSRQRAAMGALGLLDSRVATPGAILQDAASGAIAAVSGRLSALDGRTATTFINTVMTTIRRIVPGRADGGYISGPGGPRDDAIPTMLSNGEFVVNAAATARNRGLLEGINAQKMADGGFVRPQPVPASAVPMRAAMNSARQSLAVNFGRAEVMVRMPDGSSQVAQMRAIVRDELAADERFDYVMAGG